MRKIDARSDPLAVSMRSRRCQFWEAEVEVDPLIPGGSTWKVTSRSGPVGIEPTVLLCVFLQFKLNKIIAR